MLCRARLSQPHTVHVMPEEIGSALGRKLRQSAPRCWSAPHPCAPPGDSCSPNPPCALPGAAWPSQRDTKALSTAWTPGPHSRDSLGRQRRVRLWEKVGLEGTGHLERRREGWHSGAPQSHVSPLGAPIHLLRPRAGLGYLCHSGARCWHWGSLCDRAAGGSWGQHRAERGTRPGPQQARGDNSHSHRSHSGSVTLGWRGSETQTTEGPKPTEQGAGDGAATLQPSLHRA